MLKNDDWGGFECEVNRSDEVKTKFRTHFLLENQWEKLPFSLLNLSLSLFLSKTFLNFALGPPKMKSKGGFI